jgi:predicted nucleic acid-binding Zn ribbon protein
MPTYDYKNLDYFEGSKCPEYIEIFHKSDEKIDKTICQECGKEIKVQKVIGNFSGIHFKGTGFYVNDHKKADQAMKKYYPRDPNKKKYY